MSDNETAEEWRDKDECEHCDAEDEPLRAIKMQRGRRRLLCIECFVEAYHDDRVDPDDARVNDDGSLSLGVPRAPGQKGGAR